MAEYVQYWRPISFPRKALITSEGEVERYLYFVEEGVQRSFYIYNNKEHIIAFTYPPSASGIPESFYNQSPSRYYLETLTPSRLLRITFTDHQRLMAKHRQLETLSRISAEQLLSGLLVRYFELMAYDMETRFKSFVKRSPHLLQFIPQKYLAAYLRIDPTNFSKLMGSVKI